MMGRCSSQMLAAARPRCCRTSLPGIMLALLVLAMAAPVQGLSKWSFLEDTPVLAATPLLAQAPRLDARALLGVPNEPSTCPAGSVQAFSSSTLTPAIGAQVPYSSLRSLGWDTPAVRVHYTNPAAETTTEDFWSVMCNSFGNVAPDRVLCLRGNTRAGAVHLRYDCSDQSLWVLAYVYDGITLSPTAGESWAIRNFTLSKNGKSMSAGDKFLIYDATKANRCGATCTASASPTAWCCQGMWPVYAGTTVIGWMGKATFGMPANTTSFSDNMLVHFDWGVTGSSTTVETGSSSTGQNSTATATFCLTCAAIDVSINLTATPATGLLGYSFQYSVNISNVLGVTSAAVNGFNITLPAGVTPMGSVVPGAAGTPAATCTSTGTTAAGFVIVCTVDADLRGSESWLYFLPANVTTLGAKVAVAQLTKPDSNAANDRDDATVTPYITCASPYGTLGGSVACPIGSAYGGASVDGTPLSSLSDYAARCCVPVDVAVNITATPVSQLLGAEFVYNINISNVLGVTSTAVNGFTLTLPAGVQVTQPLVSTGSTPPVTCQQAGSVITCSLESADLGPGVEWTFSLAALTVALGGQTATVQLTKPDSNPSNDWDDATVNPFVTCGFPYGLGATQPSPTCQLGTIFQALSVNMLLLPDLSNFAMVCCVSQADLPFDLGITATPCKYADLRDITESTVITQTFTVTANVGYVKDTQVDILVPNYETMGLLSVTAVDPSNIADYTNACSEDLSGEPGTVIYHCQLWGTMSAEAVPPSTVLITLSFRPTAVGRSDPISATIVEPVYDPAAPDVFTNVDPSNDNAQTCLVVFNCPVTEVVYEGICQPAPVDPCADEHPTVYLSTGSGADPPNGLWRIRDFTVGEFALVPEFLCTIKGMTGQVGDIAALFGGDIVVMDTAGNLSYIPVASLPTEHDASLTRACTTRPLFRFNVSDRGGSFSGLSSGFRSDQLLATTGEGHLYPLIIKTSSATGYDVAMLPSDSTEQPVDFACSYKPPPTGSTTPVAVSNTGGTDVTPGPDGFYYRWCSKDAGMNYTGTRYITQLSFGIPYLTGGREFVSNKLSDQNVTGLNTATYGNAGAFCTKSYVIGTGTYAKNADTQMNGRFAEFWAFGYKNGTVTGADFNFGPYVPPIGLLQNATLVAKTDASSVIRLNGLRVNGAAVVPRLRL